MKCRFERGGDVGDEILYSEVEGLYIDGWMFTFLWEMVCNFVKSD